MFRHVYTADYLTCEDDQLEVVEFYPIPSDRSKGQIHAQINSATRQHAALHVFCLVLLFTPVQMTHCESYQRLPSKNKSEGLPLLLPPPLLPHGLME